VRRALALLVAGISVAGLCVAVAGEPAHTLAPAAPPARLVPPTSPERLATVELTEDAQAALGLELAVVETLAARETRIVPGEVMVPIGRDIVLAAPVGGRIAAPRAALPRAGEPVRARQPLLSLIPMVAVDRNARASAERDVAAARASLELAEVRTRRTAGMLSDGSGSQRARDEAETQRAIAQAELEAARSRLQIVSATPLDADTWLSIESPVDGLLRGLRVAPGQTVPAGTPLVDIAGAGRWVKVSLSASDAQLALSEQALGRRIGRSDDVPLAPVLGPPSADPLRGSVDRYFLLPPGSDWIPGERIVVQLLGAPRKDTLAVPVPAVVRDAEGAAWVYENTGPGAFRRRRVEPLRREGPLLLLARGLVPGSEVVSTGAVELWGFELGADR